MAKLPEVSVGDILKECAGLRGVGGISGCSHRTIIEFAGFVDQYIWAEEEDAGSMHPEAWKKARDAGKDFDWNDSDTGRVLHRWAELFLVYCKEAYGKPRTLNDVKPEDVRT